MSTLSITGRWMVVMTVGLVAVQPVAGQDWTGWLGAARDGIVPERAVPVWSDRLAPVWTVAVGGGRSSPIGADDRVFVHSRRAADEVVTAIALTTGEVIWQRDYPAPFAQNTLVPPEFMGPFATPLLSGGRVFTLGVTAVLSSWDAETGELIWRHDYSDTVSTTGLAGGTAASPLLESGALIVQIGSDVLGGRILSLDPETGEERWTWTGPGPAYASPIAVDIEDRRQIVALTHRSLVGLDVATGVTLWSTPFEDEWIESIATPLWTGRHIVISGPRLGTHAFVVRLRGGTWRAEKAWANSDVTMYMTSPLLAGGTIYGHSTKRAGQFVALNAATGALMWSSEGRVGDAATLLLAGDSLVYLTGDAELIVALADAAAFRIEHDFEVADAATWAMPLLLSDGLLVRAGDEIIRLSSAADGG